MQPIQQFLSWFSKQKLIGKVVFGCAGIVVLCCLCSIPLAMINSAMPTPVTTNTSIAHDVSTEPSIPETQAEEEKTFLLTMPEKEIIAHVYTDPENPEQKIILFDPDLDKTDGNLYYASLNALWNIYGKERGLFLLEDAKTEYVSSLGGNAICWVISNPEEDFCVFPIKDSETESIAALRVWIR